MLQGMTTASPPFATMPSLTSSHAAGLRLETLLAVDGRLLSRATHWFAADRVPGLAGAYSDTGSITAALRDYGIDDYLEIKYLAIGGIGT